MSERPLLVIAITALLFAPARSKSDRSSDAIVSGCEYTTTAAVELLEYRVPKSSSYVSDTGILYTPESADGDTSNSNVVVVSSPACILGRLA